MKTFLRGWDNDPRHRSGRRPAVATGARDAAVDSGALAAITDIGTEGDHAALTVYYNGACPVCRKHIARFQSASARGSRLIAWADAAAAPWALRRWHVGPEEALLRVYAVADDGRLLSGAAAFARLWRELPGYRALGRIVGLPVARQIAEALYRRIYVRDLRRRLARERQGDAGPCGAACRMSP
jgi:predicted DCC family thiol-disulfide oxidoreductase YuxK